LFQPTLIGRDIGGVQHLAYKTVMGCDFDVRKPLFENVVLSGGSTCYPGFDTRLQKELGTLLAASPNIKVNINNVIDRKYAVWYGGSVLAGNNCL
jgi:actin